MKPYDHTKIEKKWQKYWESKKLFHAQDPGEGISKKFFGLIEFPFPSGDGLHVGHIRSNTAMDVISRKRRMEGYNVLYPIGWDAFGLPTENYAIKTGKQPALVTKERTAIFKKQLKELGFSFDWSREVNTSDPKYYKWTQWIFLQLFKKGLAYKKKMFINWCPKDLIGLANEEVVDGKCERCGTQVEKREKEQWMLAITKYAERLDKDLDETDFLEKIKIQQRNWIGKSEGAEIEFRLTFPTSTPSGKARVVLLHGFTATPQDDFHPWLKSELEKLGYEVEAPELPDTEAPTEVGQVNHVLKNITFDERTILLGHSLGSVVALKVLEKLNTKIAGLITVGGFCDTQFKDHDRNFEKTFTWNFDFKKIKENTGFIKVLQDIHDDAITDAQAERLAYNLGVSAEMCEANDNHFCGTKEPKILAAFVPSIKVFTTRPDTLYGVTYIVLSPEHTWVGELLSRLTNRAEVETYINSVKKKTDIERTAVDKEKTGVELKGVVAINPANGKEVPVWIADYVLADYGTGAVMAVPAHDERDGAFAKKYNLEIKEVIDPLVRKSTGEDAFKIGMPISERNAAVCIIKHWSEDKYLGARWKKTGWQAFVVGGIETGESSALAAVREAREETDYQNFEVEKIIPGVIHSQFYQILKKENRFAHFHPVILKLKDSAQVERAEEEKALNDMVWLTPKEMDAFITHEDMKIIWKRVQGNSCYTGEGILINSEKFIGKSSAEIKKEITLSAGGNWVTKFKLRDWIFSRQRYWGEPIPVVHCERCGIVPLPEKDLPLKLPKVKNYKPTENGESPLASVSNWVNTKCPTCRGKAKRETDTMPNWAGSSWYYLRYVDPRNSKAFASKKKLDYWTSVDWYNGGMEHTTLHLLYSRFWHKFLFDIGQVPTSEPYKKRTSHGLILAGGGVKMSKSVGNVINPDTIVKTVGADALRLYEMFMGPFDQHIAWDENGIVGTRRFIEKVWKLREKVGETKSEEALVHKLIKKVSGDIETMKFNTAISALMIAVNEMEKQSVVSTSDYAILLQLLSPYAPHVAEELWVSLGNKKSILLSNWPAFDPAKVLESSVKVMVQVNGKVRGSFDVALGTEDSELEKTARILPEIQKWVEGKEVKKVIIIKGKVVNIVI